MYRVCGPGREGCSPSQPIDDHLGGNVLPTRMNKLVLDEAPVFRRALEMWFSTVRALILSLSPISTLDR